MKDAPDSNRRLTSAISVFGLGKLGAPFAATAASKLQRVIAVDTDQEKIKLINQGQAPVFEPGLEDLLKTNGGHLEGTEDAEYAILGSEATFVIVATPSDETGAFSLRYMLSACEKIGHALRRKNEFHTVVITSTVMPGATDGEIRPLLERVSGKSCGIDFGLCYSPEFIALGSVIHDLLNPDFILIGESDTRSGDWLESYYKQVCNNTPPFARMNCVNAELTKIAVNTFVTTKISFANMLARMCERLPGADVDTVTSALGMDSRIGLKYLKGAVGYGGPCFPRDNVALAACARSIGSSASLAEATDAFNRGEVSELAKLVKQYLSHNGVVGVLGLAYKPNTDVTQEAQGLLLAKALVQSGVAVAAYDPAAMPAARQDLDGQILYAESAAECIRLADVVVVVTAWDEFREIDWSLFEWRDKPLVLIDCWRLYKQQALAGITRYVPLGIGPEIPAGQSVVASSCPTAVAG